MFISLLVAALVISSSFILSSAQLSGISQECATTYNVLFVNTSESAEACANAYYANVEYGNATDQQKMLVCDDYQPCNDMIENVIDACGDMINSPTKLTHALSCATDVNGTTCISTQLDDIYDIYREIERCLYCTQDCVEYLTHLNNTVGCCTAERFEVQLEQEDSNGSYVSTNILTYAATCAQSLGSFTLCNGDALSPTACSVATADIYGSNDECGRAVEDLLFNNNGTITKLFNGNCPTRFLNYTTACRHLYGDQLVQLANIVYVTSQASTHDGRSCSEVFQMIPDTDVERCNEDFFVRKCSSGCRQALMDINSHYGCCYNTYVGELSVISYSNIVEDQFEIGYATITRDIYELCEVESSGFCTGTTPPPYSEDAKQCSSVANSFSPNDNCLSHYYALGLRSSADAVNSAAAAICANDICTRHMSRYINYLLTCQVVSFDDGDDDDNYDYDYYDNDDDEEEADRILASVIGNTTCRADSYNNSCYFTITSSPVYTKFLEAFDLNRPYTLCGSVFTESTCWEVCAEFLREAEESLGCCLVEYGRAVLGNDGIQRVSTVCDIPLDTRCPELEVYGSVNSQKGTQVPIALLLGMITILFAY